MGGGALFGLSNRSNNINSLHKSAIGAELHGDSSFLYHQAAAGLGRKLVLEGSGIIWRFPKYLADSAGNALRAEAQHSPFLERRFVSVSVVSRVVSPAQHGRQQGFSHASLRPPRRRGWGRVEKERKKREREGKKKRGRKGRREGGKEGGREGREPGGSCVAFSVLAVQIVQRHFCHFLTPGTESAKQGVVREGESH